MEYLWAVVVAVVVLGGLWAAARGRGGSRADDLLAALGFHRNGASRVAIWNGRQVVASEDRLHVALQPAPLPYQTLARALGRGELLGALHELRASASEDRLEAELARGTSVKGLRRAIDRIVHLAEALEALPRAEATARWFLELATGNDRGEALALLLRTFPDAPETLAACRVERDHPRDATASELAKAHLARFEVALDAREITAYEGPSNEG